MCVTVTSACQQVKPRHTCLSHSMCSCPPCLSVSATRTSILHPPRATHCDTVTAAKTQTNFPLTVVCLLFESTSRDFVVYSLPVISSHVSRLNSNIDMLLAQCLYYCCCLFVSFTASSDILSGVCGGCGVWGRERARI